MSEPILQPTAEATAAAIPTCALCSAALALDAPPIHVNGAQVCAGCATQIQAELAAEQGEVKDYPFALFLGLLAALVSGALWAAIVVVTDYEIGYAAVGVGYLVGMAVKFGAGKARSQTLQLGAALLSIVGLIFAKYFTFAHLFSKSVGPDEAGQTLGYFAPQTLGVFPQVFVEMLSPFDALWVIFAVITAYRIPAPSSVSLDAPTP